MRTLTRLACLALLVLSLPPVLSGQDKPVRIASGVSGHIHPALCLTKKGTLLCIFSQSDFKDLRVTRSTDGGKTWSKPTPFPQSLKQSIYPGSLTTLKDGRVLHAWNVWYMADKKKSRYVEFSLSDDDGQTWSEPVALPKNAEKESIIRHPIVDLDRNAWLFPLADRTVVFDPTTLKVTPFDSTNHGLVPIVQSTRGTLVSGAGLRKTKEAKDWEKVKKPFEEISKNGWRYEMLALSDGRMITSEILGSGVGGNSIRYLVSRDDGVSWEADREYYNPGRPIGGRACPKSVEFRDGTLGIVFYDVDARQPGGPGLFYLRVTLLKTAGRG